MKIHCDKDLSREHEFKLIATKYNNIACYFTQQIESDHLLAILLEIPSDSYVMFIILKLYLILILILFYFIK